MANAFEEQLCAVNALILTPLVRAALQNESARIIEWQYELLEGGAGLGAYGIARLRGYADVNNATLEWTLICKAVRGEGDGVSQDPEAWNYWKREVLAYKSDLLADLPPGVAPPRCFGITKQDEQEYWIWLEDLGVSDGDKWTVEQYRVAARHLGRFNGAYLVGRTVPSLPWLNTARIQFWIKFVEQNLALLNNQYEDLHIQNWLDSHRRSRIMLLWKERDQILDMLERLPHCLCHHDAFSRNLIMRRSKGGHPTVTALDWAMVGPGSVGQEIASMLGGSLVFMDADISDAKELEQIIFTSYLAGLRDTGWQGHVNLVRFGYSATLALVWGLGLSLFTLTSIGNETWSLEVERVTRHSYAHYLQQVFALTDFALDLGEEALALIEAGLPSIGLH